MHRRSVSMAQHQIAIKLIETLDHIERRVELLRQEAVGIEQEKSCLLELLETIQNNNDLLHVTEAEREEIHLIAERLTGRCMSVDVSVSTPRNAIQQEALSQIEQCIEELLCRLKMDLSGSMTLCQSFLNACLPEPKGSIDQRFQRVIIECAADDQKKIRKRLESLLRTIEHSQKNVR